MSAVSIEGTPRQTVELIAKEVTDTATDMPDSDSEEEGSEVIERNGGDDGARTRDLRRDRPRAPLPMRGISFHFQFVARNVKGHFSGCYSRCYSSRRSLYASSGIQWRLCPKEGSKGGDHLSDFEWLEPGPPGEPT